MSDEYSVLMHPFSRDATGAADIIERLLAYAVSRRASDIHADPRPDGIFIRIRIDGLMVPAGTLPSGVLDEFISRLKILSGARTDLHAVPQDGRWRTAIGGIAYTIRTSFMPTYYGENAVMRLLPASAHADVRLTDLGFTADQVRIMDRALAKTTGLILVTGPTGSGKTTTLHACITSKAHEPISIITLEDPVEYEIPSVRQIHIHHARGVSFAGGLRAALRQDPDVIMVGEIRDAETARVAIHTALTGHLVLSTLHTNSALESVPRLIDMGVDHYLLSTTLNAVAAQRLVRTICASCGGPSYAEDASCVACDRTGYSGRTSIAEVLEITPALRSAISQRASLPELAACAAREGFRSMEDGGLEKVDWGMTTREEIARVLYDP